VGVLYRVVECVLWMLLLRSKKLVHEA
jgi:hypothetical protein